MFYVSNGSLPRALAFDATAKVRTRDGFGWPLLVLDRPPSISSGEPASATPAVADSPASVSPASVLPLCFVVTIEPTGGARRRSAARQLAAAGAEFRFIDGAGPGDPAIDIYYDEAANYRAMKRPLSRGEVAAYLSHRRALEAFLKTDAEFAIVLEDDFGLVEPDRFAEAVIGVLRAPVSWDLIKLFDYGRRKRSRASLSLGQLAIVEYKSQTSGMVGYIARRSGAEKLTSRSSLFRPIDEDIKFYWELDLRVFSVAPNLVTEISDGLGGSSIGPERQRLRDKRSIGRSLRGNKIKLGHMLRHFLNRGIYGLRSAIRGNAGEAGLNAAAPRDLG